MKKGYLKNLIWLKFDSVCEWKMEKAVRRFCHDIVSNLNNIDSPLAWDTYTARICPLSSGLSKFHFFLQRLFFNLDKLVSCDRPADYTLW